MRILRFVLAIEALCVALWVGGLLTLGAIVAPLVFGMVPAPTSADTMTAVFQRFDRVAMTAATLALLCEVAGTKLRPRVERADLLRAGLLVVMAGLVILQGAVFSPEIADLHRRGAVRGSGPLGQRLDLAGARASASGKLQFALGGAFFGLLVAPPHAGAGVGASTKREDERESEGAPRPPT